MLLVLIAILIFNILYFHSILEEISINKTLTQHRNGDIVLYRYPNCQLLAVEFVFVVINIHSPFKDFKRELYSDCQADFKIYPCKKRFRLFRFFSNLFLLIKYIKKEIEKLSSFRCCY